MRKASRAAESRPVSKDDAGLLPLERFDHPALRRRPPKWLPLPFARMHLNLLFSKACAGLNPEVRVDGWEIALGFRNGTFSPRELATLHWAAAGLQEDTLSMMHVMGRVTLLELAHGVRQMGWHGRGLAWELNAWGRNPLRPLPSLEGSVFRTTLRCTPKKALSLLPGHPDRREWLEDGLTGLTMNGLTFIVSSDTLERFQRRQGLLGESNSEGAQAKLSCSDRCK